ncbi:MAG: hypothetical protein K6A32_04615 [Bacteroidales bacterium]|nr:hypothetical protein [Bacteroidales bacterium]
MKTLLYLHGFAGSGASGTATSLRNALYEYGVQVLAPDIPLMPNEAIAFLRQQVEASEPDLIVATSMGAMYAEQLHGHLRILVNPSFGMARLLTFGGMGRKPFRNPRQDGAKDFKVDKEMISQFRELEKQSCQGITADEQKLVYGLFGTNDKRVNCQPQFKKAYGTGHFSTFEGEHYLNDAVLKHAVLPLIRKLLAI